MSTAATTTPEDKKAAGDFNHLLNKEIRVTFTGGRTITGILKGYDHFTNLVLENAVEHLTDLLDSRTLTGETRKLGRIVCRSTSLDTVCVTEGLAEIDNPFADAE